MNAGKRNRLWFENVIGKHELSDLLIDLLQCTILSMRPSVVTIYFRIYEINTVMRTEVYTVANFLAICGGLLGLFLGVSVLSIIEFFYFSTLRLYLTLRQWKTQHNVLDFRRNTTINCAPYDMPNVWIHQNKAKRQLCMAWWHTKKMQTHFSSFFHK